MGGPGMWKLPTEKDYDGFEFIFVTNPIRMFAASMVKHAYVRALQERDTGNWYPEEWTWDASDKTTIREPVDFQDLLWLLDPDTGDVWFTLAEIDYERTKRELLRSDAFQRLRERIRVGDCAAMMYRKILDDFGICCEEPNGHSYRMAREVSKQYAELSAV